MDKEDVKWLITLIVTIVGIFYKKDEGPKNRNRRRKRKKR